MKTSVSRLPNKMLVIACAHAGAYGKHSAHTKNGTCKNRPLRCFYSLSNP